MATSLNPSFPLPSTMTRLGSPNLTHHHHLLLLLLSFLLCTTTLCVRATTTQEFLKGFSATPDTSTTTFQPLLSDPTGVFALGFLKLNQSQLALSIIHLPSSEPVWVTNRASSVHSHLSFNGSLVLTDRHAGVIWSTPTNGGDRLILLNNSNLQIQSLSDSSPSVLWQSFDFPSDTLLENQNFTSQMTLFSSNGIYSMKLGDSFIGLYSNFKRDYTHIYWKHTAMQAKAQITPGEGPISARISSNGFLGMYQKVEAPVDVLPFDSFQRSISGIRRLRLELDGNLKGYYWDGLNWVSDFKAIQDECELPSSCGSYGLCRAGNSCACLDEKMEYHSGTCLAPQSGDFCNEKKDLRDGYSVLRRTGVELPFKELMGFKKMVSLEDCEGSCESNCSCWGAVFNNASGYCYKLDYPIHSLVDVEDNTKFGYFKVKRVADEKKRSVGHAAGVALLVGAIVVFVGVAGIGSYKIWRRKRRVRSGFMDDGMSPGPYRDLGSASFRSIELSKT